MNQKPGWCLGISRRRFTLRLTSQKSFGLVPLLSKPKRKQSQKCSTGTMVEKSQVLQLELFLRLFATMPQIFVTKIKGGGGTKTREAPSRSH